MVAHSPDAAAAPAVSQSRPPMAAPAGEPVPYTTWEDIVRCKETNHLEKLGRDPANQAVYDRWRADLKARYGTAEAYLRKEVLHWDTPAHPASDALPPPAPGKNPPAPVLTPCDFPYHVTPGIRHMIFWFPSPLTSAELAREVEAAVERGDCGLAGGLRSWDVLHFVNPPHLQSIKALPHAHVFARRRRTENGGGQQ